MVRAVELWRGVGLSRVGEPLRLARRSGASRTTVHRLVGGNRFGGLISYTRITCLASTIASQSAG